jgi:hypothetical protein
MRAANCNRSWAPFSLMCWCRQLPALHMHLPLPRSILYRHKDHAPAQVR